MEQANETNHHPGSQSEGCPLKSQLEDNSVRQPLEAQAHDARPASAQPDDDLAYLATYGKLANDELHKQLVKEAFKNRPDIQIRPRGRPPRATHQVATRSVRQNNANRASSGPPKSQRSVPRTTTSHQKSASLKQPMYAIRPPVATASSSPTPTQQLPSVPIQATPASLPGASDVQQQKLPGRVTSNQRLSDVQWVQAQLEPQHASQGITSATQGGSAGYDRQPGQAPSAENQEAAGQLPRGSSHTGFLQPLSGLLPALATSITYPPGPSTAPAAMTSASDTHPGIGQFALPESLLLRWKTVSNTETRASGSLNPPLGHPPPSEYPPPSTAVEVQAAMQGQQAQYVHCRDFPAFSQQLPAPTPHTPVLSLPILTPTPTAPWIRYEPTQNLSVQPKLLPTGPLRHKSDLGPIRPYLKQLQHDQPGRLGMLSEPSIPTPWLPWHEEGGDYCPMERQPSFGDLNVIAQHDLNVIAQHGKPRSEARQGDRASAQLQDQGVGFLEGVTQGLSVSSQLAVPEQPEVQQPPTSEGYSLPQTHVQGSQVADLAALPRDTTKTLWQWRLLNHLQGDRLDELPAWAHSEQLKSQPWSSPSALPPFRASERECPPRATGQKYRRCSSTCSTDFGSYNSCDFVPSMSKHAALSDSAARLRYVDIRRQRMQLSMRYALAREQMAAAEQKLGEGGSCSTLPMWEHGGMTSIGSLGDGMLGDMEVDEQMEAIRKLNATGILGQAEGQGDRSLQPTWGAQHLVEGETGRNLQVAAREKWQTVEGGQPALSCGGQMGQVGIPDAIQQPMFGTEVPGAEIHQGEVDSGLCFDRDTPQPDLDMLVTCQGLTFPEQPDSALSPVSTPLTLEQTGIGVMMSPRESEPRAATPAAIFEDRFSELFDVDSGQILEPECNFEPSCAALADVRQANEQKDQTTGTWSGIQVTQMFESTAAQLPQPSSKAPEADGSFSTSGAFFGGAGMPGTSGLVWQHRDGAPAGVIPTLGDVALSKQDSQALIGRSGALVTSGFGIGDVSLKPQLANRPVDSVFSTTGPPNDFTQFIQLDKLSTEQESAAGGLEQLTQRVSAAQARSGSLLGEWTLQEQLGRLASVTQSSYVPSGGMQQQAKMQQQAPAAKTPPATERVLAQETSPREYSAVKTPPAGQNSKQRPAGVQSSQKKGSRAKAVGKRSASAVPKVVQQRSQGIIVTRYVCGAGNKSQQALKGVLKTSGAATGWGLSTEKRQHGSSGAGQQQHHQARQAAVLGGSTQQQQYGFHSFAQHDSQRTQQGYGMNQMPSATPQRAQNQFKWLEKQGVGEGESLGALRNAGSFVHQAWVSSFGSLNRLETHEGGQVALGKGVDATTRADDVRPDATLHQLEGEDAGSLGMEAVWNPAGDVSGELTWQDLDTWAGILEGDDLGRGWEAADVGDAGD